MNPLHIPIFIDNPTDPSFCLSAVVTMVRAFPRVIMCRVDGSRQNEDPADTTSIVQSSASMNPAAPRLSLVEKIKFVIRFALLGEIPLPYSEAITRGSRLILLIMAKDHPKFSSTSLAASSWPLCAVSTCATMSAVASSASA